jgi:hypothetical protein
LEKITVTSHVGRDFLQNAAFFTTLPKVVWEYVSNSLDNPREGVPVEVTVELNGGGVLRVSDNGEGMSRQELTHFFTMHGENFRRREGKRVRGMFGTGKSAAFGIAKTLRIETRKGGLRNAVELTEEAIRAARDGRPFAVGEIASDEPTTEEDGTVVEVARFKINRLDLTPVIAFVEKNLGRYRARATVVINGHLCHYQEPPCLREIRVSPPAAVAAEIGEAELVVKVSPFGLDKDERGVDILANGNWHETTLGDVEGREFADRLFGDIDVPALEVEGDEIAAFDNTRNNTLNRANPRVVVLIAWVSSELDKVRLQLAEEEQAKRRSDEARRLEEEARRMAKILNDDFSQVLLDLDAVRRASRRAKSLVAEVVSPEGLVIGGDGDMPAELVEAGNPHGNGTAGDGPVGDGDEPRPGPDLVEGASTGSPRRPEGAGTKRRAGIFTIQFANHTEGYPRSKYERDTHTIYINLDHPQVGMALREGGGSQKSRVFLTMAYEIAAVEYAQAIPYERIQQGEQVDAAEALFSVRETVDRVVRRFSEALGGK